MTPEELTELVASNAQAIAANTQTAQAIQANQQTMQQAIQALSRDVAQLVETHQQQSRENHQILQKLNDTQLTSRESPPSA